MCIFFFANQSLLMSFSEMSFSKHASSKDPLQAPFFQGPSPCILPQSPSPRLPSSNHVFLRTSKHVPPRAPFFLKHVFLKSSFSKHVFSIKKHLLQAHFPSAASLPQALQRYTEPLGSRLQLSVLLQTRQEPSEPSAILAVSNPAVFPTNYERITLSSAR